MPKANWKQRFSYWFDHQLSRKPLTLIALLGLTIVLFVCFATFVTLAFRIQPPGSGIKEVFWDYLFQALTPNPFDVTAPLPFLLIILMITLFSLLMVSILIGLLTTSIESRLAALRRGRSKVLEKNHIVILGWSHQIFTIISELVIAHEHRKGRTVIVVLAEGDKVEMDHIIRERIPNPKNTRIICRSGSPMDLDDLEIVSPQTAGSIIVLPPDNDNPDAYVIKTILAIVNNPRRRIEPYHIVTEIQSIHNRDVIDLIGVNDEIHALLAGEQIARMIAQTSRQPGLSIIYSELLNFRGDEIYFQIEPDLVGKTYREALLAYEDSCVIGLKFAADGLRLNPLMDTRISAGDEVIAISRDYNTINLSGFSTIPVMKDAINPPHIQRLAAPEKGLILGWNSKAPIIIRELDNYLSPGSELLVISDREIDETLLSKFLNIRNHRVTFQHGNINDRQLLNEIHAASFQHIIVLAYENIDKQSADAEMIVTLLHLRDLIEKQGRRVAIVSEMLDLRNRPLADVARIDDYIVSDHLISLMLAQISENNELYHVFTELFDFAGPELYIKPVTDYIDVRYPVSFYTVVEAASLCGETAIGYRIMYDLDGTGTTHGIFINPKKSVPIQFCERDKVVVMAGRY